MPRFHTLAIPLVMISAVPSKVLAKGERIELPKERIYTKIPALLILTSFQVRNLIRNWCNKLENNKYATL